MSEELNDDAPYIPDRDLDLDDQIGSHPGYRGDCAVLVGDLYAPFQHALERGWRMRPHLIGPDEPLPEGRPVLVNREYGDYHDDWAVGVLTFDGTPCGWSLDGVHGNGWAAIAWCELPEDDE